MGAAHEQIILDEQGNVIYRKGFVLGDGTGIGKGRQIAGVIADNYFGRNATRFVLVSCSRTLIQDGKDIYSPLSFTHSTHPFFFFFYIHVCSAT